jgi:hypothetical protein
MITTRVVTDEDSPAWIQTSSVKSLQKAVRLPMRRVQLMSLTVKRLARLAARAVKLEVIRIDNTLLNNPA